MTPDRWARIDQLLDEAMERPATERSAFLDGACLDDQELRREVESLLAAHEKAEEKFLKLPAWQMRIVCYLVTCLVQAAPTGLF